MESPILTQASKVITRKPEEATEAMEQASIFCEVCGRAFQAGEKVLRWNVQFQEDGEWYDITYLSHLTDGCIAGILENVFSS